MKIKLSFIITSCAVLALTAACGGSDQTKNTSHSESSESQKAEPLVDIHSKNDTKGIGTFTSVNLVAINPGEAKKGETAFNTKCASCHTLTSSRVIGPGLGGITETRSPEWILNMITNPDENIKKDPLGKALLEEYSSVMPDFNISDEEALQILEFLRQNDQK